MFAYIDPILFPDKLTVVEFTEGQFVYPIHKNASSLITQLALRKLNYREIENLETIDVYLRDPFERYISGVQTYLRYNPEYDRETALKFIEQFLFLNSHFSLQFHWIVNLARMTDAKFRFKNIEDLKLVTDKFWNSLTRDQTLVDRFANNDKLQYYLQLDKVLYYELIGQSLSIRQIGKRLEQNNGYLYREVIQRSKDLCNVLV